VGGRRIEAAEGDGSVPALRSVIMERGEAMKWNKYG